MQKVFYRGGLFSQKLIFFYCMKRFSSSLNKSLTTAINRSISSDIAEYDPFDLTSDNFLKTLMRSKSLDELMDLYSKKKNLFKREYLFVGLRILGQLTTKTNIEISSLVKDLNYKNYVYDIIALIDQFSELEILDFFFWWRRFNEKCFPTYITSTLKLQIVKRLEEVIEFDAFSLRNLINLFYDLTLLDIGSIKLKNKINFQMKHDTNSMNPFLAILLSQTLAQQRSPLRSDDFFILEKLIFYVEGHIENFDTKQKTVIFLNISMIEIIDFPTFKNLTFIFLKFMHENLLNESENFDEGNILHVVQAYGHLSPFKFPGDLLFRIHESVCKNLVKNNEIRSSFLFQYSEYFNHVEIKKKWLKKGLNKLILEEIMNRFDNDEYLQKTKSIEKLLKIMSVYPKSQKIIDYYNKIIHYLEKNGKKIFFVYNLLEFFVYRNINISKVLKNIFVDNFEVDSNPSASIRAYFILGYTKDPIYEPTMKILEPIVEANVKKDPKNIINILYFSSKFYNLSYKFHEKAICNIQKEFLIKDNNVKIETYNYKSMIFSISYQESKLLWLNFINSNQFNFSFPKWFDKFVYLKQINCYQLQTFFYLLSKEDFNNQFLSYYLNKIRNNSEFVQAVVKYDHLIMIFLNYIGKILKSIPNYLNLTHMFFIIHKMHIFKKMELYFSRYFFSLIEEFLVSHFEEFKLVHSKNQTSLMIYLMRYHSTNVNLLKYIYSQNKVHINNTLILIRYYSTLLMYSEDKNDPEIMKNLDLNINNVKIFLKNSLSAKNFFNNLEALISCPPQIIKRENNFLINLIKGNLTKFKGSYFIYSLLSFDSLCVFKNKNIYKQLFDELFNAIVIDKDFYKKFNMINFYVKYSQYGIYNEHVDNIISYIMSSISLSFCDSIFIMKSLSLQRFYKEEYLENLSSLAINKGFHFNQKFFYLFLKTLFKFGYSIKNNLEKLKEIFIKFSNNNKLEPLLLFQMILSLSTLEILNKDEIIINLINKIENYELKFEILKDNICDIQLLKCYTDEFHKDIKINKLEDLLKDESVSQIQLVCIENQIINEVIKYLREIFDLEEKDITVVYPLRLISIKGFNLFIYRNDSVFSNNKNILMGKHKFMEKIIKKKFQNEIYKINLNEFLECKTLEETNQFFANLGLKIFKLSNKFDENLLKSLNNKIIINSENVSFIEREIEIKQKEIIEFEEYNFEDFKIDLNIDLNFKTVFPNDEELETNIDDNFNEYSFLEDEVE